MSEHDLWMGAFPELTENQIPELARYGEAKWKSFAREAAPVRQSTLEIFRHSCLTND